MKRREFLKACLTMGALGAVSRMSPAFAGMDLPKKNRTSGKARSVIEIWIWGGPCQLEAFDPKPKAVSITTAAKATSLLMWTGSGSASICPNWLKSPIIIPLYAV